MHINPRLVRFMQRIPIRWRLALVSQGLLVLLLSVLGIIISFFAEQALVTNEVNVLRNEAQVALKGVTKDLSKPQLRPFGLGNTFLPPADPGPDFNATAQPLIHALASPNTNAVVLTTSGGPMLDNTTSNFGPPAIVLDAEKVQQLTRSDTPYLLARDDQGQQQLVVLIPLVKNFHTSAILQISTPIAPIEDFLTTFRLILFLGILGTLGLAIALIFPLVSVALRPLVEIERTSRQIAQGALSMRIEQPPTDDEIGRLASSFNAMMVRLERAFQKQKRFVGDASHELRTPLTILHGNLEMLMLGVDRGDPEVTRYLTRGMFAEVRRMHRMVEDLLVLTRLDEGKLRLRQDIVEVDSLLSTVCEQALHLAKGQEVRCSIEADLPEICADLDRLQQVLLNLVDNALKYTPLEGLVELQTRLTSTNTVELIIRDTGQGIAPEELPHVFDRFYRADPSRSRSSMQVGGSGLGLAIAKELVEAQGGTIGISSSPGHGTSVTIRFPALPRKSQQKEQKVQEIGK